jgi:hypothetical protein
VKVWCLVGYFDIICTLCYVSSDEKGTASLAGKAGQHITWQVKWLGVPVRLLGMLSYTLGVTL